MQSPRDIEALLDHFVGRTEALARVTRYSLYDVMFYRSDLVTHSKHVCWIVTAMAPYVKLAFPAFELAKAQLAALVHDDAEIITGDEQMGNKLKMTQRQLDELANRERRAIAELAARFPEFVGPYRYRDLLDSVHSVDCIEAIVVKFADKMDAFGEALHEVFGGNPVFATNVTNQYGTITTPFEYYIPYLGSFPQQFPQLTLLFENDFPLFQAPTVLDFAAIARRSRPHTVESLRQKTGYRHYDCWKEIIQHYADEEELNNLSIQKEFPIH